MKHRVFSPAARVAALAAASLVTASRQARADEPSIASRPGDHPPYVFEAEPQLVLGYAGPFDANGDVAFGFRGTFNIADGFVKSINDSVGVGVGFDVDTNGNFLLPVVLQWNFWLSPHWSVFGEPGLALGAGNRDIAVPIFDVGGRLHFNDRVALTVRVGYPDLSLGVSFFL